MDIPRSRDEAREIQHRLRKRLKIKPLQKEPGFIAGVDAAFTGKKIIAAACLVHYPDLNPVDDACSVADIPLPYIPGLLSFREGPAIMSALKKLRKKPDLILFDGQGIAHPAGMGIAAHIGLLLAIPSIGCAKSKLVGQYTEPGIHKGERSPLKVGNKTIGTVLRTRTHVKPLFVSPGHLIDIQGAAEYTLSCIGKFRIPEPLRRADSLARTMKKELLHQ